MVLQYYDIGLSTKPEIKMAGYSFFFSLLYTETEIRSINPKQITMLISSHPN